MKKLLLSSLLLFGHVTYSQNEIDKKEPVQIKVNESEDNNRDRGITIDAPTDYKANEKIDKNTIYQSSLVSQKPEFPGGMEAFFKFFHKNYAIPKDMIADDVTARLFVSFIIEKNGSISNIKVIRDAGYNTGKEVIRVMKESPKWIPGKMNNKPVRVSYILPITINGKK